MREPQIHSHVDDGLPEDHPLAFRQVYCDGGHDALLHAGNNECMQEWIESAWGNHCFGCFFKRYEREEPGDIDLDWGLPDAPDYVEKGAVPISEYDPERDGLHMVVAILIAAPLLVLLLKLFHVIG